FCIKFSFTFPSSSSTECHFDDAPKSCRDDEAAPHNQEAEVIVWGRRILRHRLYFDWCEVHDEVREWVQCETVFDGSKLGIEPYAVETEACGRIC
ncbi:hypothetical protein VIGAN_04228100, partial [Vigna angularis var. angularis]